MFPVLSHRLMTTLRSIASAPSPARHFPDHAATIRRVDARRSDVELALSFSRLDGPLQVDRDAERFALDLVAVRFDGIQDELRNVVLVQQQVRAVEALV